MKQKGNDKAKCLFFEHPNYDLKSFSNSKGIPWLCVISTRMFSESSRKHWMDHCTSTSFIQNTNLEMKWYEKWLFHLPIVSTNV